MKHTNEITPDTITRMKEAQGQPLKYSQLCAALGLKYKGGYSKLTQIHDLGAFCRLEQIDAPTRYIIQEVYDEEYKAFMELNQRNKYQYYFEAALYQEFLRNDCQPIRASYRDLMMLFHEVNPNFVFAGNPEVLKKIEPEIEYMAQISELIYPMLKQWTYRHLITMQKRYVIIKREGFRLYTKVKANSGQEIYLKHEVDENSELEQKCLEVYNQAVKEMLPENWAETKVYVSESAWRKYENRRRQLVKEKIGAQYHDVKTIMIITPPTKEWVAQKLFETYEQVEALPAIETETINKILTTNKLNDFSMNQRKEFISHHIKHDTAIDYRARLMSLR